MVELTLKNVSPGQLGYVVSLMCPHLLQRQQSKLKLLAGGMDSAWALELLAKIEEAKTSAEHN